MAAIANQWWIWIRNIIIYLVTKFRRNRRIFVFWQPFWIKNGHHSKPTMDINSQQHNLLGNQISSKSEDICILVAILDSKWSPYVLLPVNIHFHWNLHFWNFNDFFNFYIGGHFEMVAILKWWPFWKFQNLNAPLEMEIHLPVKFSKDRIISLREFGRTKSHREEEEK